MGDALFDAIRADPEDDAPRLVWADRAGGERGELVVIQCALAKELPRAERLRLVERAHLLISMHGSEWAGLEGLAKEPRFTRGFVTGLSIELADLVKRSSELVERVPLVEGLHIEGIGARTNRFSGPSASEVWYEREHQLMTAFAALPEGRIRSVRGAPEITEEGDWTSVGESYGFADDLGKLVARAEVGLSGLRALSLASGYATPTIATHLADLPHLERLELAFHRLAPGGALAVLRALPRLRSFAPVYGLPKLQAEELKELLGAPETAHLNGLDLRGSPLTDKDVELVAELRGLESLAFDFTERPGPGWAALLAQLVNLVELEAHGPLDRPTLTALAQTETLRRLTLPTSRLTTAALTELAAAIPEVRLR